VGQARIVCTVYRGVWEKEGEWEREREREMVRHTQTDGMIFRR
jgi:hypothetical protein